MSLPLRRSTGVDEQTFKLILSRNLNIKHNSDNTSCTTRPNYSTVNINNHITIIRARWQADRLPIDLPTSTIHRK
jgi:hypothetical protein